MDNVVCNDDIDSTSTNNEVGDLQAGNSNIEESSVNNSSVAKIKLRLGLPFPDKESFDSDAFPRMLCNTSSVAFTLGSDHISCDMEFLNYGVLSDK
jgi:hypothetical protein